jgi:hypothetical protein
VIAREKFRVGDVVRMTDEGRVLHKTLTFRGVPRVATGRVVGFGRSEELVIIVRDGQKTRNSYHMAFWELAG